MPKVLYFDDNQEDRFLTIRAMEEELPFVQIEATDDPSVIDDMISRATFLSDLPQVIVLDVQAAGGMGFSILKALKSNAYTSKIKVIVHTRSEATNDIVRSFIYGADKYLLKFPFRPESNQVLFDSCKKWLQIKSESQQAIRL